MADECLGRAGRAAPRRAISVPAHLAGRATFGRRAGKLNCTITAPRVDHERFPRHKIISSVISGAKESNGAPGVSNSRAVLHEAQ